jgi:hypothetical protein
MDPDFKYLLDKCKSISEDDLYFILSGDTTYYIDVVSQFHHIKSKFIRKFEIVNFFSYDLAEIKDEIKRLGSSGILILDGIYVLPTKKGDKTKYRMSYHLISFDDDILKDIIFSKLVTKSRIRNYKIEKIWN